MISHYLTQTFEHWKYSTTDDDWGNPVSGWTKQTNDVSCRLRKLSGDRVVRDGAQNIVVDAKFYMGPDESVEVGDQLRNSETFEITEPIDPMSMGKFLQVGARLVQEPPAVEEGD